MSSNETANRAAATISRRSVLVSGMGATIAAGGLLGRKLVKVVVDDQASPAQEPIVTRRLIEEGCKYIVGPVGSSHALASLEVSTPQKIIQGSYASAPEAGDATRYPYHYQC